MKVHNYGICVDVRGQCQVLVLPPCLRLSLLFSAVSTASYELPEILLSQSPSHCRNTGVAVKALLLSVLCGFWGCESYPYVWGIISSAPSMANKGNRHKHQMGGEPVMFHLRMPPLQDVPVFGHHRILGFVDTWKFRSSCQSGSGVFIFKLTDFLYKCWKWSWDHWRWNFYAQDYLRLSPISNPISTSSFSPTLGFQGSSEKL